MGKIYFLIEADEVIPIYIKIGFTSNINHRTLNLQTGNPRILMKIAEMDGDKKFEKSLHDKFEKYRCIGGSEWYHYNEEIANYLKEIKKHEFDAK